MAERGGSVEPVTDAFINADAGDAACWLARVCSECGAIDETPDRVAHHHPQRCARCGAEQEAPS